MKAIDLDLVWLSHTLTIIVHQFDQEGDESARWIKRLANGTWLVSTNHDDYVINEPDQIKQLDTLRNDSKSFRAWQ